jgi:hypothetical protein
MLPVLPVLTKHSASASNGFPGLPSILATAKRILTEEKVEDMITSTAYRYHEGADIGPACFPLLTISNMETSDPATAWVAAVRRIRSFLDKERIDLRVEIIDYQANIGLLTTPILSTEDVVISAWNSMRNSVLQTVLGRPWCSIDLLHRRWREHIADCSATIVITAEDADNHVW